MIRMFKLLALLFTDSVDFVFEINHLLDVYYYQVY